MATFRDLLVAAKSEISEISTETAAEHIADGYTILDVREPDEYQEGAIPGAIHIPRGHLLRAEQFHMRRVRMADGLGQDERNLVPKRIKRPGQTMARGSESAGNEGRKLPAEHQNSHGHISSTLAGPPHAIRTIGQRRD